MTTKILTGAYAAGYTLSASYDRLTVSQPAQVTGAPGAPGAYGHSQGSPGGIGQAGLTVGFAAAVKNAGTITGGVGGVGGDTPYSFPGAGGGGGVGVVLAGAGDLINRGGAIDGGAGGEGGQPGGDPHDSPGYSGAGAAAVYLGNGARLDNIAGSIVGGAGAAAQFGGQGEGHDGAAGGDGVVVAFAGSVGNAGVIAGGAAGAGFSGVYRGGTGGTGGAALFATAAAVTLVNKGTMVGGAGGAGGYTFDGYDTGGTGGDGGAGALFLGGGSLINTGVIAGGAGGIGGAVGYSGTQQGVSGTQGAGVMLQDGAVLTNGSARQASARLIGSVGVEAGASGAATVVNFGTIDGTGGVSVQLVMAADRLVVEAGSTFVGVVLGGGAALELAKTTGTITGLAGGNGNIIGGESLSFSDFGDFIMDKGGTWTLSGALVGVIDNAGLIEATRPSASLRGAVTNDGVLETNGAKATLTVMGAVSGSGSALVGAGILDFTSTFSQDVKFATATATGDLELADSLGYGGTISGFSTSGGTRLDLLDVGFTAKSTKASFAGNAAEGVLTVTDGTHTAEIKLRGDYLGDSFALSSDKQGGTLVMDTVAGLPSVHVFACAMAGMHTAANAGFATQASHGYARVAIMLARPVA